MTLFIAWIDEFFCYLSSGMGRSQHTKNKRKCMQMRVGLFTITFQSQLQISVKFILQKTSDISRIL